MAQKLKFCERKLKINTKRKTSKTKEAFSNDNVQYVSSNMHPRLGNQSIISILTLSIKGISKCVQIRRYLMYKFSNARPWKMRERRCPKKMPERRIMEEKREEKIGGMSEYHKILVEVVNGWPSGSEQHERVLHMVFLVCMPRIRIVVQRARARPTSSQKGGGREYRRVGHLEPLAHPTHNILRADVDVTPRKAHHFLLSADDLLVLCEQ